ncbi:MAG: zinc ABC transporter substrate-binding protein [Promethearchaeota archaeon]|nr:MAG: zinc ABC transporter substrate-binding protein [Candidatus Lokiarchaeota archaeon]
MQRKTYYSLLFLIFLSTSLQSPHFVAAAVTDDTPKIQIFTSVGLLQDFVHNVGGDLVELTSILVEGTEDPHTYEPTQSDITALINADMFFLLGRPGLEPWWAGYKDIILPDNPYLNITTVMNDSMVQVDPLLGTENPHGWMSPLIAKEMVKNVYLGLSEQIDPADGDELTQNYHNYIEQLDALIGHLEANRSKYEGLKVVVHHPSFMYLLDFLGIERIGVIEEQHEVEPSPQHIQTIKDLMVAENCTTLISQANLDKDVILQLARDTNASIIWGVPLLGMDGSNGQPIETYIEMIEYNIWALDNPETPDAESSNIAGIPAFWMGLGFLIPIGLIFFNILEKRPVSRK